MLFNFYHLVLYISCEPGVISYPTARLISWCSIVV